MTSVIENRAMRADHPIGYFLTIHMKWRSRFTMWECGGHGGWTEQDVPVIKELLPRMDRLIPLVKRFQVLCEGGGG